MIRRSQFVSPFRTVSMYLALLLAWVASVPLANAQPDPNQGPGGPILVITSASTFSTYYAEILRTEGLNEFTVANISTVTPATLANYEVAILAPTALTGPQVTMFTDWVNAGGNLIAMQPDASLNSLLGIASAGSPIPEGYLRIDTSTEAGNGSIAQAMQYHGSANRYTLAGATALATLYLNPASPTTNPAITLRSVGANGGQAASFAYDLATSIVYTRQGNPAWAAQERDGFSPIRSDDKFYGASTSDPRPDWVDLDSLVSIPQADEQQRFFANLLVRMNLDRKPLPRFWYFPHGKRAVVLLTGDDHGNGGTAGRFEQHIAQSPAGCNVANWECVRATSYIFEQTANLSNAQATSYTSQGFEVGLHINTNCSDFTPASISTIYSQQIAGFNTAYPGATAPKTERHHCIAWSDWVSAAKTQLANGIRLDTNFYFWPPGWVQDRSGHFTGSAMPMRFADLDGTIIDVYNAATQMTDESGQSYPATSEALLSAAVGSQGFYGVYTVNAHTDTVNNPVADAAVGSALSRGVPVVSGLQLLRWLDGRNASSFSNMAWSNNALTFTVSAAAGSNGIQAMLPRHVNGRVLSTVTGPAGAAALTTQVIKGLVYSSFSVNSGVYTATYALDETAPSILSVVPANGATNVSAGTSITITFNEPLDATTVAQANAALRDAVNAVVSAVVSYDASLQSIVIRPNSSLSQGATYAVTVGTGIRDTAGNALASPQTFSFTTAQPPTCPCTGWSSSTTPATPSVDDPNPVELGVKFRVDQDGFVTGVRFYKGPTNTGTHTGSLWTTSGQQLASATFNNETPSGWQQVNFDVPVPVTANTVYIASYHTPTGNYAGTNSQFSAAGVDNPPVHLLQDGIAGGNGVYAYSASSTFPTQTYLSSNYWVDVVFTTATTPPPTQLTISSISPAANAQNVSTGVAVSATFNRAVNPATVNASTFTLSAPGVPSVPASYATNGSVVTLTPTNALSPSTVYTATVTTNVKDANGVGLASNVSWSFTTAAAAPTCANAPNAIAAENCLPGNPASEWDISGAGDSTIQGFTTDISVNVGGTVDFKINTTAASYRLDIYRMGYYGGAGARKITSITRPGPQNQPACLTQPTTGLIDCGNWTTTASWTVPATAVSGIYFAKAIRADNNGASHIFFIVRNDSSTSNLLFQTSDTTWQAYNQWGGNSLYVGSPAGRAYKVSYNRPFSTRATSPEDWVFNAEYPMVRWLEMNAYDVTYTTGVDTARRGNLLLNHKVFMSVGHDEYWSGTQRANVEAARAAGVHLAFFSGNEVFWKTRWENSIASGAAQYRTLVCYKETHANAKIDPTAEWTGTWRDPRFSPPADGGRPENALTGTIFTVNCCTSGIQMRVSAEQGKMRFWRNTNIANLAAGTTTTFGNTGILNYEWDEDLANGFRPSGLVQLSSSPASGVSYLQDFGSTYGSGSATHSFTLYKHNSGALVFGAGTTQYSWGLDNNHDRGSFAIDSRMQQATVNLLADMGAQPAMLQPGLIAAVATADTAPPASTITSPTAGANVAVGSTITITGTAADAGAGVIASVEVSTDGGATWSRATGQGNWSFTWRPTSAGQVTIRSRASDDSGNVETPGAGVTVTVGGSVTACTVNCSLWPSITPGIVDQGPDPDPVELGVRFRSDTNGTITGIRFYKSTANTGAHVGNLWSSTGQLLASAPFQNETASGWQQVNFATPVTITANTVYVASYHTTAGHYSQDENYFANSGADNAPLHAPQSGPSALNGLYAYGPGNVFPTSSYNASNYWVDVVFNATTGSPTLSSIAVTPGTATMTVGGASQQFTATGTYSNGSTQNITSQVTWTSTATNIATINASGAATAVAAGTTTIRATQGSVTSNNATLTVQAATAPLSITTTSVPNGTASSAYSTTLQATGGVTPRTWSISAGALPGGLSINATTGTISGTPTVGGTFNFTARVTDAASATTTRAFTMTVAAAPGNTGFLNPTANTPVTSNAGDNNGFQTSPANGYTTNNSYAVDTSSGSNTSTSCTDNGKDKHNYFNFGITLPTGAVVKGIEVRLDALADSTSGTPRMCVQLSWNGGATWTTTPLVSNNLTTTRATYTLGGTANTWGRTWAAGDFSNTNFRVRIINVAASTARTFSLDGVAVRVTY